MTDGDTQDAPKLRLARVRSDLLDRGIDVPLDKWRVNDGVLNVVDRSDDAEDAVEAVLNDHGFDIAGREVRKPRSEDPFVRYTVTEQDGDTDV
jgi:hypothetical protein